MSGGGNHGSKGSLTSGSSQETSRDGENGAGSGAEDEEATDYVFRIISSFRPENLSKTRLEYKLPTFQQLSMIFLNSQICYLTGCFYS